MSTNFLNENNWKKLDMIEFGQNYSINLLTNEIRNDKTGRILKQSIATNGHMSIMLCMNGKTKRYYVHQLVYTAHYGLYDKSKYVIDHINHNSIDNNIKNLRLVTQSVNLINKSHLRGIPYEYRMELPDPIVINEEHGIYYCKQLDKFFRKIAENQFREVKERKDSRRLNDRFIVWKTNKKTYRFTTTTFRQTLL